MFLDISLKQKRLLQKTEEEKMELEEKLKDLPKE